MEENIEGLNLVLLGKTGAGKSASGNTILRRPAFKSEKSPKSVTQEVDVQSGTLFGFPVTVYDTPGFCDTELEENEIQQQCQSILQKCNSELSAFFIVIKADRFTEEERKTVEKIEKLLGQNRLEKTWLLFTRGDELEDEKKTIKEFVNDTEALKNLVQKYDQRYHVFNNKKRGPTKQVQTLITNILKTCYKKMVNGAMKRKQTVVKSQKPEHTSVSSISSRRIVLLGKSGVGKSAVGNTILGQKKFRSVRRMKSVTRECSEAHSTFSGRSVSVVDTPGFFDTDMSPEELLEEIVRSVYLSSPGPHAFLIVLRVDERFTEVEKQIPQIIEMLFGEEVLKYSIILFTHGDDLDGEPIEEVIKESDELRDLVDRCGGRFHVFNNKKMKNREQVNDLLQKIDSMIEQNGGGHYNNEMYEDALRFRLEEEERRLREEEERKQQEEKQRQEEIERVRKETEARIRAEIQKQEEIERVRKETEERKQQEEKQRQEEIERVRKETEARKQQEEIERVRKETEERKQQEEKQRQEEIERVRKETEEKTRVEIQRKNDTTKQVVTKTGPECESQSNQETNSGFKQFFSKYKKCFCIAILIGVVIGGIAGGVAGGIVGGVGGVAGGIVGGVAGAAAGAFAGAAAGGVVGAVVGGVGAGLYEAGCKVADCFSTPAR